MTKKKKSDIKNIKKIIIISAICLIVISIIGYFIFNKFVQRDFRGGPSMWGDNFPEDKNGRGRIPQSINETTLNEITSFFENSPSSSEIENYCNENPMYCIYYCKEINPDYEICTELMDKFQMPKGEPPQ